MTTGPAETDGRLAEGIIREDQADQADQADQGDQADQADRSTPTETRGRDTAEDTGTTPDPPAVDSSPSSYLRATPTDKPGYVISPYPPYNTLDVRGLKSGSLALDPTIGRIFRLP